MADQNFQFDNGDKDQQPTSVVSDPQRTLRTQAQVLTVLYYAVLVAPLVTVGAVYMFSIRAWMVLGYWPRPWLDDPKYIRPGDLALQGLYWLVMATMLWSLVSLALVPLLTLLLRRSYSIRWHIVRVLLFVSMWLVLWLDPGARIAWFVD